MKKLLFLLLLIPFLPVYAQNFSTGTIITQGTGTDCSVSGTCVILGLQKNTGGVSINVTGAFTGTLQFETTVDGANWASVSVTPTAGGASVTTTTAVGVWSANVSGLNGIRVRASSLSAGIAPTVTIQASYAAAGSNPNVILASGIVDGLAPVTITVVTSCTLGTASGCNATAYNSGYTFNQYATAGTKITYTLPTAAVGKQYCIANDSTGSAPDTGVLRVNTSGTGQFIHYKGTIGATGGYIASGGAAGDAACFVGVSSTVWLVYVQMGTWTEDSGG